MELDFTKISILSLILIVTLISWGVMRISKTPREWPVGLTLKYNVSHPMSGHFSEYYFTYDSVHVHTRGMTPEVVVEEKYTKKIAKKTLEDLLVVMRDNQLDKMRIRKTNITTYDGTSFSFHLVENGQPIVMLSNSANEELNDKDEVRLNKILKVMRSITSTD